MQVNPTNPLMIGPSHTEFAVKFWLPQRSSPPGALNKTASLVPGNYTASADKNPLVAPPVAEKCEASMVSVTSNVLLLSGKNDEIIVYETFVAGSVTLSAFVLTTLTRVNKAAINAER
jgi:hypothetical protein